MKKLLFLIFLTTSYWSHGQIWSETFDEAAGANSGTGSPSGAWSTTCVGCNTASFLNTSSVFEIGILTGYFAAGRFGAGGTGMNAEGIWTSPAISISGYTDIKVYIETSSLNTESGDYLALYYMLNTGSGFGSEILFHTATNGSVTSTGISPALNGTQVQIVARAFTNAVNDGFTFDNISVTNTLYSRATGVWGTSGTWSAVSIGGSDCTCTPTQYNDVVVGGGNTVTIGAAATAASLLVNGTADTGGAGILTYSGNFALDISRAGAVTVNTGGQLTSGGNLSSALTFTDNQSHTITNNGTLSIGDLTVTNSSAFSPTVITLAGSSTFALTDALSLSESSAQSVTLTNGVTMTIAGAATINNTSTFTNNSTVTMSSTAAGVLSGSGTWTQGTSSTLNYAGQTITITTFNASNTGNTVNYNRGGIQTIFNTDYHHLTLSTSGAKSASGSFIMYGNWTRNGTATFTPGANTVNFRALAGTSGQSITAVGGETFSGLVIFSAFATSPQVTLNNPVTVSGVFNMTAGNVDLNGNSITLSSNASGALVHGLTSASGWMYGGSIVRTRPASTVITVGVAHSLFPLGSSADWRPFFAGQTSNANSAGTMTISHTDGTNSTTVAFAESIVRSHNAFWTVSTTGISAGPTFDLRAGGTTFGTIEAGAAGLADLRMCTNSGIVGTHGAATGGPDYRVNRTAVAFASLANSYHVASTDATNSPLPIELLDFNVKLNESAIDLTWTTASELNNDFFTIERATDLEKFEEVTVVKGQGTFNSKTNYNAVDESPLPGTSYYRLKQTDFDGKFTYSELKKIENSTIKTYFTIYPNPVIDRKFNFELSGISPGREIPVKIVNLQGVSVFEAHYHADQSGRIKASVALDQVSSGMYIVIVNTSIGLRKKVVIP